MSVENIHETYRDIKLYQINTNFYDLIPYGTNEEKIQHIINYHKDNFKSIHEIDDNFTKLIYEPITYSIYVFNEFEFESQWKHFLPEEITNKYEFNVKSTSFVLFAEIGNQIFAIIGGKGISAIKRFINHSFGIDLYEKIADPTNDVVYSLITRGVAGNLTAEQKTFRNEQKLQDSFSLGEVPIKINLQLRQEIKDSLFDFINFQDTENIYVEIGSSFCIKWKLTFHETHLLILTINNLLKNESSKPLSRFERIKDDKFINEHLKLGLYSKIRDDMVRFNTPTSTSFNRLDFDFAHPDKLHQFYECDNYKIFTKGSKSPFYETRDRTSIYYQTLNYLYTIVDSTDQWDFNSKIAGIRVRGYLGEKKITEAPFINHLTCELPQYQGQPFFLINNNWYRVKGDFINSINDKCASTIKSNELLINPLDISWKFDLLNEDEFNLLYVNRPNYYILDKMLGQNIELCDILYETDKSIYLIHVKKGFDAKIRDLTNQISISANRLWNDLNSDMSFIDEIYNQYSNSVNFINSKSLEEFKQIFKKEIIYVLAYSHNRRGLKVANDIQEFKSNIAKFSIIETMRYMQSQSFPLKIIEISNE